MKTKNIIILLVLIIGLTGTAQARYVIPWYHADEHVTEYGYSDLGYWLCAEEHADNHTWALWNLYQLADTYGNGDVNKLRVYMSQHLVGTNFTIPSAALEAVQTYNKNIRNKNS